MLQRELILADSLETVPDNALEDRLEANDGKSTVCSDRFGYFNNRVWLPGDIGAIHRAQDLGVNRFDTAEAYGKARSEALLSQALGSRRKISCSSQSSG